MPNEFVARNGIIALNNSIITGSLNVTQGVTASLFGTASWASNSLTSSNIQGGAANYIPLWNTATSISSSVIYQSSGNIGIGTISPYSFANFRFLTIDGTNGSGLRIRNGGSENSEIYGNASALYINTITTIPLTLGTNGTERMRITSDGEVLIGTTTDAGDYKLQVLGNSFMQTTSGNATFTIQSLSTQSPFIEYKRGTSQTWWVGNGVNADNNFAWYDQTNNAFRMTLTNTGNLGIGLTAPATRLHVSASTGGVLEVDGADTAGANALYVSASGDVGIGTSSPTAKITVVERGASNAPLMSFVGNAANSNYMWSTWRTSTGTDLARLNVNGTVSTDFGTVSSSPLVFVTNANERVRIDSSGNVGIGLIAAGQSSFKTLEIGGSGVSGLIDLYQGTSRQLRIYNSSTDSYLANITNGGGMFFRTTTSGGTQNNNLVITSAGDIGIGTTTPNAKLDVNGNAIITGSLTVTSTITAQTLVVQTVTSSIDFVTGSTRFGSTLSNTHQFTGSVGVTGSLTVNNSVLSVGGTNVGIGTSSPSDTLHVVGNARIASGYLQVRNTSDVNLYLNNETIQWRMNVNSSNNYLINDGISDKFFIGYSTGNVGIGTTSPNQKLEVAGIGRFTGTNAFSIGGDAGNARIQYDSTNTVFRVLTAGDTYAAFGARAVSVGAVYAGTAAPTSGMIVEGNVGIGTTSPATRLHISASTGGVLEVDGAGTAGANALYVSASGNVGIGTSSPGAKLEIAYTTNPTTATPHIILTTGGTTKQAAITADSFTVGGLVFSTGDGTLTDRMTILRTNGNVGIGTTSPSSKLDVSGEIRSTGNLANFLLLERSINFGVYARWKRPDKEYYLALDINNNGGTDFTLYDGTAGASRLVVSGVGNVGIGASTLTSGVRLTSNQDGAASPATTGTSQTAALRLQNSFNNVSLDFGFDTSNNTWIQSTNRTALGTNYSLLLNPNGGNIGIGTTSPNAKLDVSGSAIVSGSFTVAPSNAVELQVTSTGTKIGNIITDAHTITGSLGISGSTVIIGSLAIGTSSLGSTENALVVGLPPAGGAGEGGQILLQASGGLYTSASMLDNYQNRFRILRGTNVSSDAEYFNVNLHNGQITFNKYSGSGAFTGTAAANLAVDSGGNIITVATGGGGSAPTAVTFNRVTGSYTFALTDAGKTIEVSGSTATSHSLTIPASSSVDFADGTYIDVILYGTGSILFATASGVTIRSANSWNRIGTRYGAATLVNISGNEWYLIGNINA